MSTVRCLRIVLGHTPVGLLFGLDDGRVYFRFDKDYVLDARRPLLSVSFLEETEQQTQARLLDTSHPDNYGGGQGRLPVFFRNLLPEGVLRKHLISEAAIAPTDELGLLAFCGKALPGDVWALPVELDQNALAALITNGRDSYEFSSEQLPTPQAVSLSGVQPKVSLFDAPGGRYVMRSKDGTGKHFIGKLPASDYALLPEVEHTSMLLARAAGVRTCETELLPLSAIADRLPFSLREDARNFLLVHRFDRDVQSPTGRMHMEDLAQVLSVGPDDKYAGTYAAIGIALNIATGSTQHLLELLRRITVNELLGNYDAHLKNFSLLLGPDGVTLSPAYDIVAYSAYLRGRGHAMKFYDDQEPRQMLTPVVIRQLSNDWEVPEKVMAAVVKETLHLAMTRWPDMINGSPMSGPQKAMLKVHLYNTQPGQHWLYRNPDSSTARDAAFLMGDRGNLP